MIKKSVEVGRNGTEKNFFLIIDFREYLRYIFSKNLHKFKNL
jgi:hypothetical protein